MIDPTEFGKAMGAIVRDAIAPLVERLAALEANEPPPVDYGAIVADAVMTIMASDRLDTLADLAAAKAVADHMAEHPVRDGCDGKDGAGVASALIDRDGVLVLTMTDGSMKSLGVVVGRDGSSGADGRDGLSMAEVTRTYDASAHEVVERWSVDGMEKELRYPAGGIRPGGFWREGMKSVALQAVTHDGALWIAKRDTAAKPCLENSDDWQLAARKGRDGRDGKDGKLQEPVKLGGGCGN